MANQLVWFRSVSKTLYNICKRSSKPVGRTGRQTCNQKSAPEINKTHNQTCAYGLNCLLEISKGLSMWPFFLQPAQRKMTKGQLRYKLSKYLSIMCLFFHPERGTFVYIVHYSLLQALFIAS